jgi:hypothetical protein
LIDAKNRVLFEKLKQLSCFIEIIQQGVFGKVLFVRFADFGRMFRLISDAPQCGEMALFLSKRGGIQSFAVGLKFTKAVDEF